MTNAGGAAAGGGTAADGTAVDGTAADGRDSPPSGTGARGGRPGAGASFVTSSTGMKSRSAGGPSLRYAWTAARPPRSRCGSSTMAAWGLSGCPAAALGSQQPRCSRPVRGGRRASRPQYPRSPARARRKWVQVEQVVDDRRQTQQRAVSACGAPQCGQCHMTRAMVAAHASPRRALPHRGMSRFCHAVPRRLLVTAKVSFSHRATGWQAYRGLGARPRSDRSGNPERDRTKRHPRD
jgi:hypothetical protein